MTSPRYELLQRSTGRVCRSHDVDLAYHVPVAQCGHALFTRFTIADVGFFIIKFLPGSGKLQSNLTPPDPEPSFRSTIYDLSMPIGS